MPTARDGKREADDIPAGTVVGGHYRIERKLGGGAIGQVYEAVNTWTTRRVAMKILRRDFADDPEIAQRFLIEARAATTVAHPNIVDILDMGEDTATHGLYLVQEFLEGRDLHEHLSEHGRLTLHEAQDILLPVMHALAAAHEKGVLHRDLKPENVFLVSTPEGPLVPKVIDFGLARTDATAVNRVTRIGAVMGTPFYMSPEQARGDNNVDARTDVWAMGVLWYETLAGTVPFEGDNLQAVLHQIFMVEPRRIDQRVPEVPAAVADAIHQALSKDIARRYPSMSLFLDALYEVLPDAPEQPSPMRSSRPGRTLPPGARTSGRPTPTPTPMSGTPKAKLAFGPPRKPDGGPTRAGVTALDGSDASFAETLHAHLLAPGAPSPAPHPAASSRPAPPLATPRPPPPSAATQPAPRASHAPVPQSDRSQAPPPRLSSVSSPEVRPVGALVDRSEDAQRIRRLQLALGLAVVALVALAGAVLYLLSDGASRPTTPTSANVPLDRRLVPPRPRPVVTVDAAAVAVADAVAVTTDAQSTAPADAALAVTVDAAPASDGAAAADVADDAPVEDRRSRRRHRSRDDDDEGDAYDPDREDAGGSSSSRRSHRSRRSEQ